MATPTLVINLSCWAWVSMFLIDPKQSSCFFSIKHIPFHEFLPPPRKNRVFQVFCFQELQQEHIDFSKFPGLLVNQGLQRLNTFHQAVLKRTWRLKKNIYFNSKKSTIFSKMSVKETTFVSLKMSGNGIFVA